MLQQYLASLKYNIRLDDSLEQETLKELSTHIDERVAELKETGLSQEDAENTCIKWLGSAKMVARQLYEAHSRGTWQQTLLATLPHLLFALTFTLHLWQATWWLLAALALTLAVAIFGWWRGKPVWLFPWLGYSMVPVVAGGILLLYLPQSLSWLAILLYVPLVIWLFGSITIETIKRDWIYGSLMLFPVPIIIGWIMLLGVHHRLPELDTEQVADFTPWIGVSFLLLALTVALFVYLRRRWLKITVLAFSGTLTLTMVAFQADGRFSPTVFTLLILVLFGLFLSPALLERRIRHSPPALDEGVDSGS